MLLFDLTSAFELKAVFFPQNRTIERLVLKIAKHIMIFYKAAFSLRSIIVTFFPPKGIVCKNGMLRLN